MTMTANLTAPQQSKVWGEGFSMEGEHKVVWGILNPHEIAKDLNKKYDDKKLEGDEEKKKKG